MAACVRELSDFARTEMFAWDTRDSLANELMECKRHERLFEFLNKSTNDIDNIGIYKKSKHDDSYYHLSMFKISRKTNSTRASISTTIREVESIKRRTASQKRYEENMTRIIALIQYGKEVDSIDDMTCMSGMKDTGLAIRDPKTGKLQLTKMGLILHHIRFKDRNSSHKERSSVGPSQLLRNLDLTNVDSGRYPANIKALNEFLSCVILNAGHHNQLHVDYESGGYENFEGTDVMPFHLRSKKNYDYVCSVLFEKYGYIIDMDFDQRVASLKLNP